MEKKKRSRYLAVLWCAAAAVTAAAFGWYALDGEPQPVTVTGPAAVDGAGLDLNTATAEELDGLPGIGPVLAAEILAWREENGAFTGREDVLAVPGIGPATYEQIAPYIRLG